MNVKTVKKWLKTPKFYKTFNIEINSDYMHLSAEITINFEYILYFASKLYYIAKVELYNNIQNFNQIIKDFDSSKIQENQTHFYIMCHFGHDQPNVKSIFETMMINNQNKKNNHHLKLIYVYDLNDFPSTIVQLEKAAEIIEDSTINDRAVNFPISNENTDDVKIIFDQLCNNLKKELKNTYIYNHRVRNENINNDSASIERIAASIQNDLIFKEIHSAYVAYIYAYRCYNHSLRSYPLTSIIYANCIDKEERLQYINSIMKNNIARNNLVKDFDNDSNQSSTEIHHNVLITRHCIQVYIPQVLNAMISSKTFPVFLEHNSNEIMTDLYQNTIIVNKDWHHIPIQIMDNDADKILSSVEKDDNNTSIYDKFEINFEVNDKIQELLNSDTIYKQTFLNKRKEYEGLMRYLDNLYDSNNLVNELIKFVKDSDIENDNYDPVFNEYEEYLKQQEKEHE